MVLAISVDQGLQPEDELWLAFRTSKSFRYLAGHKIATGLGLEKPQALPMFHALTGCDTASSFTGHGKKTAWEIWTVLPELTDALLKLSSAPSDIPEDVMHAIDRFVILLYDRTSTCTNIDKTRKKLFAKKNNVHLIPPTETALEDILFPQVVNAEYDFGWGIVVNFQKKANQSKTPVAAEPIYVVDVLLYLAKETAHSSRTGDVRPYTPGGKGEMQVVPVLLYLITAVSAIRLYFPQDLRPLDNRMSVLKSIQEVEKRFPDGLPQLDPIDDIGIKDRALKEVIRKTEAFEHRMYGHPLHSDPKLDKLYSLYESKVKIASEIKAVKVQLKKKRSLLQMDELKCRKRVLRRMGYATASDVIEMKGRVACEISSADELLITEMLFNGVFNELTSSQCCALLSVFVFQEKASEMPKLTEALSGPLRIMQDTARRIAKVSIEAKLELDEENYVESFRPNMMDIVHAWCKGCTFAHICTMTDIFEGSIIRCMRRLEEVLRQMCQAAKAIGNTDLEKKFAEAIREIKRDIVFAASLYF
ncbi:Exosome RNA helicase MTR4 [Lamellibrachia satsuma]|nr:Exosome RNA helicase MTR4 [Lamellibrachia satsuma]